jgi:CHAT domain-containing protein
MKVRDRDPLARLQAEILVAEGDLVARKSPGQALESLSAAISVFSRKNYYLLVLPLYLQRSRLYLAMRNDSLAISDLKTAVHTYEQGRTSIVDPRLRAEFFRQSIEAFDELVGSLIGVGKTSEAFEYVERARSRVLLDSIVESSKGHLKIARKRRSRFKEPLSLRKIQARLANDVVIVEYSSLRTSLAVWIIDKKKIDFVLLPFGEVAVRKAVDEFGKSIVKGDLSSERLALERAYDMLIKPIEQRIAKGRTLVVVPDKSLSLVPFACLMGANGRFLVEDREVLNSPSATIYLSSVERDKTFGRWNQGRVLIVADPLLRVDAFPDLVGVHVGGEFGKIKDFYRGYSLLRGSEATKSSFLEQARIHEIVHFAGHAFVNEVYPLLSGLALAGDSGSSGALYAGEIYDHTFPRTRLVVLAACKTVSGFGRGDDLASIARPFIAGGVPAVIGSLWKVSDNASEFIMTELHYRMSRGEDALSALHAAQVKALRSGAEAFNRPSSWGSFVVVGGISQNDN